jgi:hypothetical protein
VTTEQDRAGPWLGRPTLHRRVVLALWFAAVVVAAIRIAAMVADPSLPGEPWQTSDGHLEDFRDVVWVPGNYVLGGGNPYDPGPYLAAHPWAQQFSPYPPAWLLLGVVLAPLPFLVAGVVFQVLALGVAVVLFRVLCTWALPRFADLAVPVGLLWVNVWYPGRGSLASLGSILAVLGVALVLRSVTRPDRTAVAASCAAGVAVALVKPQFGVLTLAVAVAGGRVREAWRGVVAITLACLPMLAVVTVSAGGPGAFAASIRRNLDHVHGANTPAGLASPFQRRFDLLGTLAHFGLANPPGWLLAAVPALAVVITVLVVRRTRNPFLVSAVACSSMLLGFFHPWYDVLLVVVPLVIGLGMLVRGELTGVFARLAFAAFTVVAVHLHTVSTFLVPGLSVRGADTVDVALVAAALVCAVSGILAPAHRTRSSR